MRRIFLFILLQIVTLYGVSAHCHFVMDNADEQSASAFSGHCIDENIVDFECGEEFREDNYIFCEEVACTRRPEAYKTSVAEISPGRTDHDTLPASLLPDFYYYPQAENVLSLSSCYSFIVRLTPF